MKTPKMILFDYGQTLMDERGFDGIAGTKAILKYAVKNPYNRTAEEVQKAAEDLIHEYQLFSVGSDIRSQIEVPNRMFNSFLYSSLGIELSLSPTEIDGIFWNAAAPISPTEGIEEFLLFLNDLHIKTAVISNMAYCGKALEERLSTAFPKHRFEFIISSADYMFRKPNRKIFELALLKADLKPQDVWYIGDQYDCDIKGSENIGIFPVWYTGAILPPNHSSSVLKISNWDELKNILKKE